MEGIEFIYEGVKYRVTDPNFYNRFSRVVLPDKRVLHINNWLAVKDTPVRPLSCDTVDHTYQDLSPEEIARRVGFCSVAVAV
ncbi:hypothetical protein A2V49_01340 [candidate division WWE3 bacterium RBG_19FT_COMBO_34_6]|uniref:Uncharacterized protein n=1 Tax=candidate division WWE3 bacterium RBG_19FT_COMBO_34_6 TaxID=1802612 RepID=A0A1F4UJY7_UNCKA|nr:MAG: hypothetical protein A2V49_01340 [candidate division WWE3 bacterium RBG_19FT_COMBO_34_6]